MTEILYIDLHLIASDTHFAWVDIYNKVYMVYTVVTEYVHLTKHAWTQSLQHSKYDMAAYNYVPGVLPPCVCHLMSAIHMHALWSNIS